MSSGTLSLLGLYSYDNSIFENLALPDGVDHNLMINTLLRECAEMEILYPNPEFLKQSIGFWSTTELDTWSRLQEAFTIQYNPIWNVDGTETEIEKIEHDISISDDGRSDNRSSGNVMNKVAGYNSNTMQNSEQSTSDDSSTLNSTNNRNDAGVRTREYTKTRGGNIGVTMSQQLLQAELDVRPKLNIYRYITEDFKSRFCLMIY